MTDVESGQVSASAAAVYESFFVPALFREPADQIVSAVGLSAGQSVLDVACGTGVLARAALGAVDPGGRVVGLDRNGGMLAVARSIAPAITWQEGLAETLPFNEASFDAVLSQFGLMFFDDRAAALREMRRVAKPNGVVGVAVWDSLERTPGYAAMTDLLHRLFGAKVADALRAPFVLGDQQALRGLMDEAGMTDAQVIVVDVTARFPSIEDWVRTDVKGWTLADMIDDDQFELLRREAKAELARFAGADGTVSFKSPALLAVAR
jgi:ubiquinone/menaquinone biosynthesis C-methylase UbiE